MSRSLQVVAAGLCLLCLPACTTPGSSPASSEAIMLPIQPVIDGQERCGLSAALAVAAFHGVIPSVQEELARMGDTDLPDTVAVAGYLRGLGLECRLGESRMEDLESEIRAGRPLIVLVPSSRRLMGLLGSERRPAHCWVLCGLDPARHLMYYLDPYAGPRSVRTAYFRRLWQIAGDVAIRCEGSARRSRDERVSF